jgi:hypothetical protein
MLNPKSHDYFGPHIFLQLELFAISTRRCPLVINAKSSQWQPGLIAKSGQVQTWNFQTRTECKLGHPLPSLILALDRVGLLAGFGLNSF